MRITTIIIAFCLGAISSAMSASDFAILYTENPVMLYHTAFGPEVKSVIKQNFEADSVVSVELIEDSQFRFRVKVRWEDMEHEEIEGWLDKVNCNVFLWATSFKDNEAYMNFYATPAYTSDYETVRIINGSEIGYVVHFLGGWYYVVSEIDGKIYQGWVARHCDNIYNSCN